MDFFLYFLIPTAYQTMHCQSKLNIWYVLFWSYYGPGRLDLNRTIKGGPQDVVCWLSYGYLLNVEPKNLVFIKTIIKTDFDDITITFTYQNGRPLKIEDEVNLILLIN